MRLSRLSLLLTAAALTAMAAPAAAQDVPVIVEPPLAAQPVEMPGSEPVAPDEMLPPLVVPADLPPAASGEAAVPAIPAVWGPVPFDAEGRSAYGLFLSGRLASFRGDYAVGSELFGDSQALVPEQPLVSESAVRAGLLSGDIDSVARISPAVQDLPGLAEASRLAQIVEAVRNGEARAGLATLKAGGFTDGFEIVTRFLLAPVAAAAGDWETALAPVVMGPRDPAALVLIQQRAQLLEGRRRHAEAEADYQRLMAIPVAAQLFGQDYAAFLKRRGRSGDVLAHYRSALTTAARGAPASVEAEARALARSPAPALGTPVDLAAYALRLGATFLGGQPNTNEVAAIYLRLSEQLQPDDETALVLGQTLAAGNQDSAAREAFARVGRTDSMLYARAQVQLGQSLAADGQADAALEAFRRADAAASFQPDFALTLVSYLNNVGRHEEALSILERPSLNTAEQPADVRFERGRAFERLGRLAEAENELWAALQAVPDNPMILNHLGYMWVDSGRRVDQGAEMLARAFAADPDNGNIQDSVGWAQFRQGQYEAAVETLEGAVNKLPGNATIVDHLGDAYWQVGRRREAEWQWSRVLTLDPDAATRARVERKLADGLSVEPPVSAGQF
jgi:tetratricopeptide (TPR) repeat protein